MYSKFETMLLPLFRLRAVTAGSGHGPRRLYTDNRDRLLRNMHTGASQSLVA